MYVLDTNTVIHFFKGVGGVSEHLLAVPPADIQIPSVVLFELTVGVLKSDAPEKRRTQLDTFMSSVGLLPFGRPEAEAAAAIRHALEEAGQPIGPFDTLIGGTAMANGATLVTRNVREFARIEGLDVVSWYRKSSMEAIRSLKGNVSIIDNDDIEMTNLDELDPSQD